MTLKDWERRVLAVPGAAERVAEIEHELRRAAATEQVEVADQTANHSRPVRRWGRERESRR